MGGKQSSNAASPSSGGNTGVAQLKHAVVLHGLRGAGASTIQRALDIKDSRMVRADDRFLTSPPIFTNGYNHANTPHYAFSRDKVDQSAWSYGGRGSFMPRWSIVANACKAVVLVVDSTDRARLTPAGDLAPLPDEFVVGWHNKSAEEQREILATLTARLDVKSILQPLLEQMHHRRPLLVLATKQDLPGAMSPEEICTLLDLPSLRTRDWRIAGCDGLTGEGLAESVQWLNYVIAHPTDFSKQQAAEAAESAQPDWEIGHFVHQLKQKERDERLARGDVLRAPPLLHTNGQPWVLTAEQQREFVVAPITLTAEEQAELAREADPTRNLALAKRLLDSVHEEEAEESPQPEPATASPPPSDSDAEASERSRSSSDASDASATDESPVSLNAPTVTHTPEPSNAAAHTETLGLAEKTPMPSVDTAKKQRSFGQVSSTYLALTDPSVAPQPELVLRKKHWYSRKATLLPPLYAEDPDRDIYEWVNLRSRLML